MSKALLIELEETSTSECKSCNESDCRRTEFLGEIVSASTFAPPGSEIDTSLRCRKRPEHKLCHGLIRVHLQEDPVELRWWCPVCGDNGVINNWKGIPWKKSHIRSNHTKKNNEFCEIILPLSDFELLKQISVLEPVAEKIVQNAMQVKNGMILVGTVDAIDTLIGYIAFEANHEQKPRRQQMLNKLFDKICSVLKGRW